MYPTPHINATPEDFAKTVLMPGDPLRAKYMAETFLENPDTLMTVPVFLLGNNQLELVTDKHMHFRLPQSLLLPTVPC